MAMRLAVAAMRQAISPRLAIRIFLNMRSFKLVALNQPGGRALL
jgi:hypothetical protein